MAAAAAVAAAVPCLSIVSLYGGYLRRSLSAAGLSPQSIDIDAETTLHYWGPKSNHHSPTDDPKKLPAVVLIHGFGPDAIWQWRQQAASFARRDFAVYVPSLVFFGDSATASPERSEVFQAVSVGKMMEKLGIERYSVVGTSYGGFVAYHVAAMWPERVEKVVICSSGVNMRRSDNAELLKRAKLEKIEEVLLPGTAAQLRALLGLAIFRRFSYLPDFLLNDVVHKLYSGNRKEKMELLKGLTLGKDDTVNLSPLQQEVLIVWGDHDQIFPLEKATELKEIMGEKARLEVIKNTAHVPQIENPRLFNNIVYNFLRGCGPSSSSPSS